MFKEIRNLLCSTASVAIAAALFTAAPLDIRLDGETKIVSFETASAWAKGGDDDRDDDRDDDDNDDDNDDDRDGDDDRDDDDGDRDDDSSGRGSDDDRDDDDDSSGRGGRDDDRSGSDDHDDKSDGRGSSSREDSDDDHGIEVTFSDGSRIEIENGRYERKDASGRTVEERPARRSDYAKLQQAGTASGGTRNKDDGTGRATGNGKFRGGGRVANAESSGSSIEITYTDGWKEEIENGRYELKDPDNRTVVERRARQSDYARLSKAFR